MKSQKIKAVEMREETAKKTCNNNHMVFTFQFSRYFKK